MPQSSATKSKPDDGRILVRLRMAPFERRKNGWRFGTKRITDGVIERLIAAGRAVQDGEFVRPMLQASGPLDRNALQAIPDAVAPDAVTLVMISAPPPLEPAIDASLFLADEPPV